MDIYATPEPVMLDERALSERLGVKPHADPRSDRDAWSRTAFVKTVPRRGIIVVRRTKSEIVDMIRAWAALEKHGGAADHDHRAQEGHLGACAKFFQGLQRRPAAAESRRGIFQGHIAFHQALISLSESPVLVDMTNDILLHVRGYRQLTIGRTERIAASCPSI